MNKNNVVRDNIEEIPLLVLPDNAIALDEWMDHGIKNATLVRIDANPSMGDGIDLGYRGGKYHNLDADQVVCGAVDSGVVDSVYWINPHVNEEDFKYSPRDPVRITDLGSTLNTDVRLKLGTTASNAQVDWSGCKAGNYDLRRGVGQRLYNSEEMNTSEGSLVLDINLEGICTSNGVLNVPMGHDGLLGYNNRIVQLHKDLQMMDGRPDIITVTTGYKGLSKVPDNMVNNVKDKTIHMLKDLYDRT